MRTSFLAKLLLITLMFVITNCKSLNNKQEVKNKENTEEKKTAYSMIRVNNPAPNALIESPLIMKGEAVGYWYHEGSFVVKAYGAKDQLLGQAVAKAKGQWMTEDFVPFEATLKFEVSSGQKGRLVFERANPSGLSKNDQQYVLPVQYPAK